MISTCSMTPDIVPNYLKAINATTIFQGLKDNIKLTTLSDYSLAESILDFKIRHGEL